MSTFEDIEKIETIYGLFYSWKDDLITDNLRCYSAHARNELAMIKSFVRDGDNILDIGAHIGTFSIPFAMFNNQLGHIFSFEANSQNYKLLCKNISANDFTHVITPINAVVSEKKSAFTMMTPPNANSGMYYFIPDTNNLATDLNTLNIDKWHEDTCPDLKIHLIKIDVEGAEVSVLRSCQTLIEKYRPLLYIEVNPLALNRYGHTVDAIESILKPLGYHFFRNIGKSNSTNDSFTLTRLKKLDESGHFFDTMAIHSLSTIYPNKYVNIGSIKYNLWKTTSYAKAILRKLRITFNRK